MKQDVSEVMSDAETNFDLAWKRTFSLSEAGAESLKAGISPENVSRFMVRPFRTCDPSYPLFGEISPEGSQLISKMADRELQMEALANAAALIWQPIDFRHLIATEKKRLNELATAGSPRERQVIEAVLVDIRATARTLFEQRSFKALPMASPIVSSSLVHSMITAGRKALVEFDRLAINGRPLSEVFAGLGFSRPDEAPRRVVASPSRPSRGLVS